MHINGCRTHAPIIMALVDLLLLVMMWHNSVIAAAAAGKLRVKGGWSCFEIEGEGRMELCASACECPAVARRGRAI
jgi:hypothetical protein